MGGDVQPAASGRCGDAGQAGASPACDGHVVRLARWHGTWDPDDPFAGLRADVITYGHEDPLGTLRGLAQATGIPVGALARYVLARWAAGGADGILELGVSGVDHMERVIAQAEADGGDDARLEAYHSLRDIVSWLRAGIGDAGGAPEQAGDADPDS